MRKPLICLTGALFALLALAVESNGELPRTTPIVKAVRKTAKGIVRINVSKPGAYTRRDIVGTGVIVDARGYVVTAHHVIADAQSIQVVLHDGTSYKGVVHAEDPRHDLAILRLPGAKGLTPLPFGNGSDLMVGETVIAIGNPFGYTRTVSTGIVSALERQITMPSGEKLGKLTQTNAAVNPGNSGGPLLNINGEWIGVIVALRDGAQNIGFALNIDTVNAVVARSLPGGSTVLVRDAGAEVSTTPSLPRRSR